MKNYEQLFKLLRELAEIPKMSIFRQVKVEEILETFKQIENEND